MYVICTMEACNKVLLYYYYYYYRDSGTFILCQTVTQDGDWAGKTHGVSRVYYRAQSASRVTVPTQGERARLYFLHTNQVTIFYTPTWAANKQNFGKCTVRRNIRILGRSTEPRHLSKMAHNNANKKVPWNTMEASNRVTPNTAKCNKNGKRSYLSMCVRLPGS